MAVQADVNLAAQEGADGQYDGARTKFDAALRDDAHHALALDLQIGRFLLEQGQIRLGLEHAANCLLVEVPIGLRTGGAYRGALADAADRRIAAHLTQRLDIVRQEQGALAHARSRKSGFGARMAAADHDYPVFRAETHHAESTRFSTRRVL